MKILKYISSIALLLIILVACEEEEFGNLDFVNNTPIPTNVTAVYDVTQDNTGLVTLTPTGNGVTKFIIDFGDGTTEQVTLVPGENVQHTYEEGVYNVVIQGFNSVGKSLEVTQELVVSFNAPENMEVTITNSETISKQVSITTTADFATMFEFYSGEDNVDQPVATANIGESIVYTYETAGTYTMEVIAKGAAIETTSYTEDFEVTAILQPITSAPTPPNRGTADVISIYSSAYTNVEGTDYFPDWGQAGQGSGWAEFDLNGDTMLQYSNLSYQGIQFGSSQDVSAMEYLHLDVWTTDVQQLETSLINIPADGSGTTEAPVVNDLTANEWTSIDIPISDYTDQGLTINEILQLKFVGIEWAAGTVFIDNIYFWKSPSEIPTGIIGTWKLSTAAGAIGVGPFVGDIGWWNCDDACVIERACYYDDEYIFSSDGTFQNNLGDETWVEGWQGGSDSCAAPVAPHDGSNAATFIYDADAGVLTLNGQGAYLAIPKAYNGGELGAGDTAPNSITYNVELSNNDTEMDVYLETASGVFWQYKFVKEAAETSPLEGTWMLSTEAGAIGVGPFVGDIGWWNCDDACVVERACYYDDQYIFNADGSFENNLGDETWVEGWQGGSDSCAPPVAPHDGSSAATYSYDQVAGTLTLSGQGAYIGVPKAYNGGELGAGDTAPDSITYTLTLSNGNTEMDMYLETGSGVFWQYKLVKQ